MTMKMNCEEMIQKKWLWWWSESGSWFHKTRWCVSKWWSRHFQRETKPL